MVVCSGVKSQDIISYIEEHCRQNNYVFYNYPMWRLSSGWARNKAGLLTTSEIISLCDIDDPIHPQKCEYIKKVFEDQNVTGLVHSYYKTEEFNDWQQLNFDYELVNEIDPNLNPQNENWFDIPRTNIKTKNDERVAHGPISCRSKIIIEEEITYDETMLLGEDGKFCQDIVLHESYELYYTPQKLILYNCGGTEYRQKIQ